MADYQWKAVDIGYTVKDLGVVNTGKVWRWQVGGRKIVSQRGLLGWLRPTVRDTSILELMERAHDRLRDTPNVFS